MCPLGCAVEIVSGHITIFMCSPLPILWWLKSQSYTHNYTHQQHSTTINKYPLTTINIHNHSYTHSDAHLSHGFAPMPHCPRPEAHGKVHPQDSAMRCPPLQPLLASLGVQPKPFQPLKWVKPKPQSLVRNGHEIWHRSCGKTR